MSCTVINTKLGSCQETISQISDKLDKQILEVRIFISRNNVRTALIQELVGLPGLNNAGHEHTGVAGGAGERRMPRQ